MHFDSLGFSQVGECMGTITDKYLIGFALYKLLLSFVDYDF